MPSRKQRRKRAKERRHEYEYVYVDEEGNEVDGDAAAVDDQPRRRRAGSGRASAAIGRGPIQPPSWRRVGKRGLILAPLMFITVHLLGGLASVAAEAVQTVFLMAFFLPFSYLMDSWMYRRHARRTDQDPATGRR